LTPDEDGLLLRHDDLDRNTRNTTKEARKRKLTFMIISTFCLSAIDPKTKGTKELRNKGTKQTKPVETETRNETKETALLWWLAAAQAKI
jgi:hypothetical protein